MKKNELLKSSNYLLTEYQLEIFKELTIYKNQNNLSQVEIAKKFNVSPSYISQILNGNFNFTLKKLIELGIYIGKVPSLKFLTEDEFWEKKQSNLKISNIKVFVSLNINKNIAQNISKGTFNLDSINANTQFLPLNQKNYV